VPKTIIKLEVNYYYYFTFYTCAMTLLSYKDGPNETTSLTPKTQSLKI